MQVLSALSTIIAIIEFLKTRKGVILKLFVMLFTVLVFAVSFYSHDLTAAPDLIGKYYSDACRLITDAGLQYEPMSVSDRAVVIEQSVVGIAKKGTVVQLVVEDEDAARAELVKENSRALIEQLKNEGVPCHDLRLVYIDKAVEIFDYAGHGVNTFGEEIPTLKLNEIKLVNTDYDLEISDYEIEMFDVYGEEKQTMVFRDVPSGYYELSSNLEGYQILLTKEIKLSTDYMQGTLDEEKYWGREICLVKNDSANFLPYRIKIVDHNGSGLEGRKCAVSYKAHSTYYGTYETEDNGEIPLTFFARRGEKVIVHIFNKAYTDVEYSCEVTFDDVQEVHVISIGNGVAKQI